MSVDCSGWLAELGGGIAEHLTKATELMPADTSLTDRVAALFSIWKWMHGKCCECGETYCNSDLRDDEAYFESGNAICRNCWIAHDGGTIWNPEYKAPDWPETLNVVIGRIPQTLKADIYEKGTDRRIGTVTHYKPNTSMGRITMLDHPDHTEIGTVGGDVDVRNIVAELQDQTSDASDEPDEYLSSQCERFTGFVRGILCNVARTSRQASARTDKKRPAVDKAEEQPPGKKQRARTC